MTRRSVDVTYHGEQAVNMAGVVAFYMIEAWDDATIPHQTECRLPALGKGTGAVRGGHMA
ncbi:hypothetical protein OKW36_006193 [Paraburkholderia sp. MM5482-R1]